MVPVLSLLAALQQQPSSAPTPALARVTIQPAEVAVQVGDTVRLAVSAVASPASPFETSQSDGFSPVDTSRGGSIPPVW